MALIVGGPSLLRDAVFAALSRDGGAAVIEPDHDDPFGAALHRKAIVYLPAASLAGGERVSSPARMRAVLRAAHAPGVQLVILVLPLEGYDDEVQLLRRDGKPYVILRVPMLIEELGQGIDGRSTFFVQRNVAVQAVDLETAAQAVVSAIDSEDQGRTIEIRGEKLLAAAALERAASAAGKQVRVLALWEPLIRAVRWLTRVFGRAEPAALNVVSRFALPASRQAGGPEAGVEGVAC